MTAFWEKVAGKRTVITGHKEYIRPLNYITDEEEVIVDKSLPILNLKGYRLQVFADAITEYVNAFMESELYWSTPIASCRDNKEAIIHAMSMLWFNATPDDFNNPIQFVKRYTNFLSDNTFDDLWERKQIDNVQSLRNCTIEIAQKHQAEFQETPTAICFTIKKDGIEKKLPRIAYGISEGTAYIYGIQGENEYDGSPVIKKINRSRYKLNKTENIPEDYKDMVLEQEPYAYMSLFMFLSLLRQKGITSVVMPAYLPVRVKSKKDFIRERISEVLQDERIGQEEKKRVLKELEDEHKHYQIIQYNITNKFLDYASRMECDVPGVSICETPEQTNGNLVVNISKMQTPPENNPIFHELSKKIEGLFKTKDKTDEGR